MIPLAHSAQKGQPTQTYREHISNVYKQAVRFAADAEAFSVDRSGQLQNVVGHAAEFHDLGKLMEENQNVLQGKVPGQRHLPINHVDAGAAYLLQAEQTALLSALMVFSHHRGLPNLPEEFSRETFCFRDEHAFLRKQTEEELPSMLRLHQQEVSFPKKYQAEMTTGDDGVFLRMALSCLTDADHGDTARNAGNYPVQEQLPALRPAERLEALDRYVEALAQPNERSRLRSTMYQVCRDSSQSAGFVSCDSPVGSGKTTAVMAHLLAQAKKRGLRRIFVVLPYTNIITQSVEVYRKALTLPGEKPDEVVAELHHRADFDSEDLRYLTALWCAPIIVTTAVGFFETLASGHPSTLRRFHELPGSAVFIDEAHAALPLHLLPPAWHWMKALAESWNCYWLLASGSLVRYWELSELIQEPAQVPELVSHKLHDQLMQYEENRVVFRWNPAYLSRSELIETVMSSPGPRLLIVNTVKNAAILARDAARDYGREHVEHLSTALTPNDRSATIERIKQRLHNPDDTDWVLVATSCVEAGVDFSFRTGFREAASMVSLLQTAGRINRNGNMGYAEVWTFRLQDDPQMNQNKGLIVSADILCEYFEKGLSPSPALSTCSIQDELHRGFHEKLDLYQKELNMDYQTVDEKFKVIDSDTVPVVVDASLANAFCAGQGDWRSLQNNSVSISRYKIDEYHIVQRKPGLYCWQLPYSSFLGYMEGIVMEKQNPLDFMNI